METHKNFIDFFIHQDVHLSEIVLDFGFWTYSSMFLLIFMETGFLVAPFLPGDPLLFAAGIFSVLGLLAPVLLFVLVTIAAILGDAIDYSIGRASGVLAFEKKAITFLKILALTPHSHRCACTRARYQASFIAIFTRNLIWRYWL